MFAAANHETTLPAIFKHQKESSQMWYFVAYFAGIATAAITVYLRRDESDFEPLSCRDDYYDENY